MAADVPDLAQTWCTLSLLHERIQAHLERALLDRHELSVREFALLAVLGRQPIPASQVLFNLLAPAVVEQRFAMGATRHLGAAWDSSLAVTRALGHSVTGPNPLEAPGQQTLTLRMDAWDVEAGLVARF